MTLTLDNIREHLITPNGILDYLLCLNSIFFRFDGKFKYTHTRSAAETVAIMRTTVRVYLH